MNWKELLGRLSETIHNHIEENMRYNNEGHVQNNWLGFSSASSKAIKEREYELGVLFPKSHVEFLLMVLDKSRVLQGIYYQLRK